MSEIKVLDYGYIKLIETWGSDEAIIEAARMSTAKGFNGWGSEAQPGDEKLLRFLWENKHSTPFEMAGATVEVKAPIFVFREWHRHRVPFGYNEASARYTPLPNENYIPTVERLTLGSDGKNRQAGTVAGAGVLTLNEAEQFQNRLSQVYSEQEDLYQWALQAGVPKELARVHLPVGRYSKMRATGNLRGWLLGFAALRSTVKNPAAQWEIRQFCDGLLELLQPVFPRTVSLFMEDKYADQRKAFAAILQRGDVSDNLRAAIERALTGRNT